MYSISLLPGISTETLTMSKTCLIYKVQIKNSTTSFNFFSVLDAEKAKTKGLEDLLPGGGSLRGF